MRVNNLFLARRPLIADCTALVGKLTAILLTILLCSSVFAAIPTKDGQILDKEIPLLIIAAGDEFRQLCEAAAIPCGEERLPNEPLVSIPDDLYGVRLENVSVRTVLDKILKHHPGYVWEITDGVLVFRPREPGMTSPLEQHVQSFTQKGMPLSVTLWMIAGKVGIKVGHMQHVLSGHYPPGFVESQTKAVDISVKDAEVREIFDLAVATHGSAMWIYTYNTRARAIAEMLLPHFLVPNFLKGGTLDSYAWAGPGPYKPAQPVVGKKDHQICILWDGLHGQRVNIEMHSRMFNGTFFDGGFTGNLKGAPNVTCIPVGNTFGKKFGMIVEAYFGRPYKAKTAIDWKKGSRVIIGFLESGQIDFKQDDGKAGFK